MKAKKMAPRLYQFNNIEDHNGNYLYPLEKGGLQYVRPSNRPYRTTFQHLTIRFPDALKMLFGR